MLRSPSQKPFWIGCFYMGFECWTYVDSFCFRVSTMAQPHYEKKTIYECIACNFFSFISNVCCFDYATQSRYKYEGETDNEKSGRNEKKRMLTVFLWQRLLYTNMILCIKSMERVANVVKNTTFFFGFKIFYLQHETVKILLGLVSVITKSTIRCTTYKKISVTLLATESFLCWFLNHFWTINSDIQRIL